MYILMTHACFAKLEGTGNAMRKSKASKVNSSTEKILQCYVHRNGKSHCDGCDLAEECRKFKKYVKEESKHPIVPVTHTANILNSK